MPPHDPRIAGGGGNGNYARLRDTRADGSRGQQLLFCEFSRQIDGIVHDCGACTRVLCRIDRPQAQYSTIRESRRSMRRLANCREVIERRTPASTPVAIRLRAPVAFVLDRRSCSSDGGRKIRAPRRKRQEDVIRRDSRGRDHGVRVKRSPGVRRWPARKSRADIGRFPSAWSSTISRIPSPAVTRRSSPCAERMVPGGAASVPAATAERRMMSRSPFRKACACGHGWSPVEFVTRWPTAQVDECILAGQAMPYDSGCRPVVSLARCRSRSDRASR